jgi:hypothetical protein
MKTKDADIFTNDPENAAGVRAWAEDRARAQSELSALHAELVQLRVAVSQPPGSFLLGQLAEARSATQKAQDHATETARIAATAQHAAADFEANQVAHAEAALDTATHNLAEALAGLLREASTTSALTATVDGLSLRQRYLSGTAGAPARWDHTTIPFLPQPGAVPLDPELVLPAVGEPEYAALLTVLELLDSKVDAVADLITAESVHQLVQGNLVRSGAAIDVAATGAVPDGFDVIRTPQTGETLTHRVLLLSDTAASPRWPTPTGPGSLADPLASTWLTTLLPDPASVGVTVGRQDPATGERDHLVSITLDRLQLDPLSLMRAAADTGELTQRLALVARQEWQTTLGEASETGAIVLVPGNSAYQLEDLVISAQQARALLGSAHALNADDLTTPGASAVPVTAAAADSLLTRIITVDTALQTCINDLEAATGGTDRIQLAATLLAASAWGIAAATPQIDEALPDLPTLRFQAAQARTALARRRSTSSELPATGDDPTATLRAARERLIALVGWQTPILVELAAPTGSAWEPLAGQPLLGAEPAALRQWLDSYALVRPAVAALIGAYDLAEALEVGARLDPVATQLSASTTSDRMWHGSDANPPVGLTNVVIQRTYSGSPTNITGLAVDSWNQRTYAPVPNGPVALNGSGSTVGQPEGRHQAAVAFHFDEPDSTPPQVVLVAVAPDLSADRQPSNWDLETLCNTLLSTLALARQRALPAERATTHGITIKGAP